jgi:hypothetical protein
LVSKSRYSDKPAPSAGGIPVTALQTPLQTLVGADLDHLLFRDEDLFDGPLESCGFDEVRNRPVFRSRRLGDQAVSGVVHPNSQSFGHSITSMAF